VDERTVLQVRERIRKGEVPSARDGAHIPVHLALAIDKDFPHQGTVNFINNQIDPATGTLLIRGVFSNPKPPIGPRLLSPGLFARVRVDIGAPYQALLVTQRALATDQNLTYIYVVDENDTVQRRDVKLGIQEGGLQVISEGLQPTDRVLLT